MAPKVRYAEVRSSGPLKIGDPFKFLHRGHRFYSSRFEDPDSRLITADECNVDVTRNYRVIMTDSFYYQWRFYRSVAFRTQNQVIWTTANRGSTRWLARVR
jgi:hypothetical protein